MGRAASDLVCSHTLLLFGCLVAHCFLRVDVVGCFRCGSWGLGLSCFYLVGDFGWGVRGVWLWAGVGFRFGCAVRASCIGVGIGGGSSFEVIGILHWGFADCLGGIVSGGFDFGVGVVCCAFGVGSCFRLGSLSPLSFVWCRLPGRG